MKILGIDFTSRPSRRKPITCVHCTLDADALRLRSFKEWTDCENFEAALAKPGPWIAGIDFPFGQARRFIETIGWPPILGRIRPPCGPARSHRFSRGAERL